MWRGRKLLLTAAGIVSCLGLSVSAWAGNVDTYGIGSKATALGGAYSAYADDPYAAYYNPAGLIQMQRPAASMGVMISDPELEAKDYSVENTPLSTPTDFEDDSLSVYPHLGFAMPLNDKWSVGLAAYVPFGLHIEWDDNSAANLNENPGAYNSYESWYYREVVTPTVAYKVNDKWSVGMGVSLGRSEAGHYYQNYALTQGSQAPVNVEGEMEDDFNYSLNVGVMYKPMDTLTLGLTYRSQADADFEGEIDFEGSGIAALDASDQSVGGMGVTKTEYDISMDDVDHPDQIQFGVRYQPHDRISLEADLVWTNWSTVDEQTVEFDDAYAGDALGAILQENYPSREIVHDRDWEDTRQIRIGVEWEATDILTLRGGYFYDPTPIPDDTFDITWPDADKKTYSLGFGLDLNEDWVVDGVFQYTTTEQDRTIGGESENLNHSYGGNDVNLDAEGEIFGYGLTVTYKF